MTAKALNFAGVVRNSRHFRGVCKTQRNSWSYQGRESTVTTFIDYRNSFTSTFSMPRAACPNGPTNTYTLTAPIGELTLVTCSRGIHLLDLPNDMNFKADFNIPVSIKDQTYQDNGYTYKPALQCVEWLAVYFSRSKEILTTLPPPVCMSALPYAKTSFSFRVWEALLGRVQYGTRISYQELAAMCDSPRAQQSVGTVMKNNPVSLIAPCHRVIRTSGGPGNYSGGRKNPLKVWLLDYEESVCGTTDHH